VTYDLLITARLVAKSNIRVLTGWSSDWCSISYGYHGNKGEHSDLTTRHYDWHKGNQKV